MRLAIDLSGDLEKAGIRWDKVGRIWNRTWKAFWVERAKPRPKVQETWQFDLDSPDLPEAVEFLNRTYPPQARPAYELLCIEEVTKADVLAADHVAAGYMGAVIPQAERTCCSRAMVHCPRCGHTHSDPAFVPSLERRSLPKAAPLISLYDPLRLYARPAFIEAYRQSRLSGLSFAPASAQEPDDSVRCLYRVEVAVHRWGEREGVCQACQTKTNVREIAFFNLPERYRHDFQVVRTYGRAIYVLSHRARALLDRWRLTRLGSHDLWAPILPGYLNEWIAPEPRCFHGPNEWPTRVLRPAGERPGPEVPIPTVGEWLQRQGRSRRRKPSRATLMVTAPSAPARATPCTITPTLLKAVARRTGCTFTPASPKDLARLQGLDWPETLQAFYDRHEPHGKGSEGLYFFSIREILKQIKALEPAATLAPLGYVPLAGDEGGNLYLHDLRRLGPSGYPRIVFANHEMIDEEMTREEVEEVLGEGAEHLGAFLEQVAKGELEP